MHSQISQVMPGHGSGPTFAAARKDGGSRNENAARDTESFQSVLDEAGSEADQTQSRQEGTPSDDATAKGDHADKDTADGTSKVERSDASSDGQVDETERVDGEDGFDIEDAEHIDDHLMAETSPETNESTLSEGETTAVVTDDKSSQQAASGSESDSAISQGDQTKGVPAWFAAPQNMSNGTAKGQAVSAVGTAVPQAAAGGDIGSIPREENVQSITAATRNATPGQADGVAGLQVKSAVSGAAADSDAKPVELSVVAGQKGTVDEEANHLSTRRTASEDLAPTAPSNRNAQTPTPAVAPPAPAVPNPAFANLQEKSSSTSGIRWMSEVGFTTDVAASEMPATSRLQQATLLQQPDLPRNIAAQLAQAMRQGGAERPMELVLNPAELGRVRISMQAGDGAMTVHVLADRPETLDLMRRHIDILAQEFHEIGYGSANFAFGQNAPDGDGANDSGSGGNGSNKSAEMGDSDEAKSLDVQPHLSLQSDRVDIRL